MRSNPTRLAVAASILLATIGAGGVAAGPSGGALPPELIEVIQVAGEFGVPEDASMVAANVTAVDPAEPGFVTVYPCDETRPVTSNVNYLAGDIAPNLVLSRISATGTICIYTLAVTDIIVDIAGYVPADSDITPLPTTVRVADTRDDDQHPVPARTHIEVPIAGNAGIDPDADVVLFNATAIGYDEPGFLTVYPCGTKRPLTSSVNHAPNQVVPNMVISRIGNNGSVCIYTLADADIIVDVAAYSTTGITPLPKPVRITDTRDTGHPQPANGILELDIAARTDIPDTATAAVYNLTSAESTAPGFATSYPCNVTRPLVSNLNYTPGRVAANGTITKLSPAGTLCIYNLAPTHLIVDLIGYTQGNADYIPLTPTRILDTREGWQSTCDWIVTDVFFDVWATHAITGRRIDIGATEFRRQVPPFYVGDCEGVGWISKDANGFTYFVNVYRFEDGSVETFEIDYSVRPSSVGRHEIAMLPDGRFVSVQGTEVVDLLTGEIVAVFQTDGSVVDVTINEHGIAAVRSGTGVIDLTAGPPRVTLWDIANDVSLGSFAVGQHVYTAIASPDGRYVALGFGVGSASSRTGVTVTTSAGDVIARLSYGTERWQLAIPRFVGTGVLQVCLQNDGIYEWPLFGDLQLRAPFSDRLFQYNPPPVGAPPGPPGPNGYECRDDYAR